MLATTEAKSKKEILEAETLIVQPKRAEQGIQKYTKMLHKIDLLRTKEWSK